MTATEDTRGDPLNERTPPASWSPLPRYFGAPSGRCVPKTTTAEGKPTGLLLAAYLPGRDPRPLRPGTLTDGENPGSLACRVVCGHVSVIRFLVGHTSAERAQGRRRGRGVQGLSTAPRTAAGQIAASISMILQQEGLLVGCDQEVLTSSWGATKTEPLHLHRSAQHSTASGRATGCIVLSTNG